MKQFEVCFDLEILFCGQLWPMGMRSLRSSTDRYVRRVGRPKNEWATKLHFHASAVASLHPAKPLESLIRNKIEFERRVNVYIA